MTRKLTIVIATLFLGLLGTICVLGYSLHKTNKWSNVYFRHMMRAEDELDRLRAEQSAQRGKGGITIPNPPSQPSTHTD